MPLQPIPTSTTSAAEGAAKQIISQITATASRIKAIRANGIPATPAQPARTLPDGRIIPAIDAVPAVPAAAVDAALGTANCAVLDALSSALG